MIQNGSWIENTQKTSAKIKSMLYMNEKTLQSNCPINEGENSLTKISVIDRIVHFAKFLSQVHFKLTESEFWVKLLISDS